MGRDSLQKFILLLIVLSVTSIETVIALNVVVSDKDDYYKMCYIGMYGIIMVILGYLSGKKY